MKKQGLFVFIDTRDSTKRIYSDIEAFDEFIEATLTFVLNKFSNSNVFPACKCKPLGDGLLIYYISAGLSGDSRFENLLKQIINASVSCINDYHTEMQKKTTIKERAEGKRFQLGISIGSGYVHDFHYEDINKTIDPPIDDIGSIALTYVFRLNDLAEPEGIVVERHLYEAYKQIFDEFNVFTQKRKHIDEAFSKRLIYVSKEVVISDEETDSLRAFRALGEHSIYECTEIIKHEIHKKITGKTRSYKFDAPPKIRFMLFRCNYKSRMIEEVYSLYGGYEGGKKDSFDMKTIDAIKKENKYPFLVFECFYEKEIVYFGYVNRYITDVDGYIAESRKKFYLAGSDEEVKNLLSHFNMQPSSGLAIPILGNQKDEEVEWILVLDSEETNVFKKLFFDYLGVSIRSFFNSQIKNTLEVREKSAG